MFPTSLGNFEPHFKYVIHTIYERQRKSNILLLIIKDLCIKEHQNILITRE